MMRQSHVNARQLIRDNEYLAVFMSQNVQWGCSIMPGRRTSVRDSEIAIRTSLLAGKT